MCGIVIVLEVILLLRESRSHGELGKSMSNFGQQGQVSRICDLHELIILVTFLELVELWHDIVIKYFEVGARQDV